MTVISMIVGATTPDGATFATRVTGPGPVRVAVADNAGMTGPVFTASQPIDPQGVAKVSITGLAPSTRYWWQVEDGGVLDTDPTGQFVTHPPVGLPASFTIAAASCAGLSPVSPGIAGGELDPNRVSNHQVHDTIRLVDPLMFVHLGDWGYPDYGDATLDTLGNRRKYYDDNLAQPNQAGLFHTIPMAYLWDDHDFAANNSDGTYVDKANGATVYRERVPAYPLPDPDAIYHAFPPIGRVLCIASDVRYERSPNGDPDGPSKTMLGTAQKTWLNGLLAATAAEFVVWLMPQQWLGTSTDSWASFQTEQAELVQMFGDHGFSGRVVILSGDYHGVALDTGGNSPGGIPVLQCASLDSSPGAGSGGTYSHGSFDGRDQYGTVAITDAGSSISVKLVGWHGITELVSHQFGFITGATAPVASGALLRTLTGSHTPILEARVVTGHPTGDDPEGTEIKILTGDVTYDATAAIRASLRLETLGVSEVHGRSVFPRFTSDLLAPFGAEVFLRYGLDLGGSILWTPLGYFRVEEDDQADAPYGGIVLAGQDRMVGLEEAILLSPRSFRADQTYGFVAETLVRAVYPDALIAWDDDSDQTELGRVLVVEESRTEALRDIAAAAGKIMYWDDEGVLRFEAAPDESVPLWEVRSGRDGVLVRASRRVTRRGVANAITLVGQAADDQPAVRAVAFDNNPASPTYFFGPFGQVPAKHESVLVSNIDQANTAALALLRRSLGAPYEVEFGAITNPTLRPWQPVRVTHRDGNRDVVVMQRVTIPLGRQPMSGTARSSIVASIGSLT